MCASGGEYYWRSGRMNVKHIYQCYLPFGPSCVLLLVKVLLQRNGLLRSS